jgi:cysteine desulfurase
MRIYLDHNATTPVAEEVISVLTGSMRDVFGNASSIHNEGQTARRVVEESRETVARLVGATSREIVFTSGGTESNNAALLGAVPQGSRLHIVTRAIEHPSVLEPLRRLERRGHELTIVPCSRDGVVEAASMIEAIRPDTKLVSLMLANNETGAIQPVREVAAACRERGVRMHCDAVQGPGKIAVSFAELGCDTMAISAHKMHAPKGIGALVVRQGLTLDPLMAGGAQERRRRAGTENVPLAAAFAAAAELAMHAPCDAIGATRDRLERALLAAFGDDVQINAANVARVPNTTSATFRGVDGEGLVIALDLAGIAVSTGAACSSGRIEPSHVLLAMGRTAEEARGTLRVSISRYTTASEVDATVRALVEAVPRCR